MSRSSSRRLLVTAAAATSVALLASACGKSSSQPGSAPVAVAGTVTSASPAAPSSPGSHPSSAPAGPHFAAGTPLISDGSDTVTIGGTPVRFSTTVSEASWSPDGSRIAFIDGSGNVATARPDGSSVVVLVKPGQGSKLSAPSWQGGTVLYTEQNAAGTHFVRQAEVVGQSDHSSRELYQMGSTDVHDVADTSNAASVEHRTLSGTTSTLVFQSSTAKGPELWIHELDSNSRGGADPAQQLVAGSWPALSASGGLAFVGSGGGIEVVTASALAKANPGAGALPATKVADGATDATHLAWTPDGKSVAYSTAKGVMEVAVDQPGAAPTQLSAKPGVVSFLPAATDRIVTLSGTSPTDLVGASIAVSQHRWQTQPGTTPQPAGGGAHGPFGMSVTIVAADDPASAQKELGWAGVYGPTLLSTGHTLDPRLASEVKRVLGTPVKQPWFAGVDTVFLVGAADAFPAGTDTAFTGLGYKVVHVTSADAQKANPDLGGSTPATPPIAIVDPSDTAALAEAKAEGAHVIQLSDGKLSATDTNYLTTVDADNQNSTPQVIAFGDKAFAAATSLKYKRLSTPTEALGTTHEDFLAAIAMNSMTTSLTVAPATSPADVLLADLSRPQNGYQLYTTSTVTIDPAQGISSTLKALLDTRAADIDEVDVVDTTGKLSADVVKQLGALASGPLGAQTVANQTADAVAKAQGGR